ncbi:PBECR4 domain-containing protein [Selenomonas ruminantium]|uniref:Phage-Barnase-EndoU-ColicinE5/D-RelE like nuclease 4 domain-containing protein n=1 Tax=Selenomonas ruminantium TaxID=971 RepID=A0A1I0W5Y5_SELRU|nr:PBECR4 domain-containing protein [Selenomonas ruminantium]SFA84072.1 hypothetical protein SAMN05216587_102205 [Selenomonas ruminantium]
MSTKAEKKQLLKRDIIIAAKTYKENLAGKVFLYVYGNEYFELNFANGQFLHLTGVGTKLKAKEFYRRAKDNTLDAGQFYFNESHPFATAKRKLQCLKCLPSLTTELVCVLKGLNTLTFTYKIGVTNLQFTLGLTENVDCNGKKINNWLLPRTLRPKDNSIAKSNDGEFVDYILSKSATKEKYDCICYQDSDKAFPQELLFMVDEKIRI